MAQYNQTANRRLFEILQSCDPEIVTGSEGSYFDSILGLLNHILVSDLGWLTAYRDSNLDLPALNSPALVFKHPGWKNNLYENPVDLRNHQEQVDELFPEFVGGTPDSIFKGEIEVTRSNGKKHTFPFGKVLMHLFNHQTHHRGAISQILDRKGVENDFSNLMGLLM
jgi:uncharacterized damage-inducible protein DinB